MPKRHTYATVFEGKRDWWIAGPDQHRWLDASSEDGDQATADVVAIPITATGSIELGPMV